MNICNPSAASAVFRRQLHSFLGNPLGYIFILFFVVAAAAFLFFPDEFFSRNICDFANLYTVMPLLLMVFVPAIAMGAWTSEKEGGTEELLLSMPVSIFDAVVGKYLAILAFFTIALAFNVSHLFVLGYLGDPDLGQMFANFFGWWLCGAAFCALGLWASVLVSHTAIAWVVGVALCAAVGFFTDAVTGGWFADLDRGIIGLGSVLSAAAVVASGLFLSLLALASKSWNAERGDRAALAIVNVVLAVMLAISLSGLAYRYHLDSDVTEERLSSLSEESEEVLGNLAHTVEVAVFISQNLPEELRIKKQEVLDKIKAIERVAGDQVLVKRFFPVDELDPMAVKASEDYGLQTRPVPTETVTGPETINVYMGAVVICGDTRQVINYFDPGLSVEYELVRAMRSVARQLGNELPVLGILGPDVEMTGGFDMQAMRPNPAWEIVQEWKRQYQVRDVAQGEPIPDDIDVLVVAAPSNLAAGNARHVHDYIYAGRPCILFVDAMPGFNHHLAPSQERQPPPQQNPYMQQQQPTEPKEDISPLLEALSVDYDTGKIAWAESAQPLRFSQLPPTFIWSQAEEEDINQGHALTKGMRQIVTIMPGAFYAMPHAPGELKVEPLIELPTHIAYGQEPVDKFFARDFLGRQTLRPTTQFIPQTIDKGTPMLAAHITGRMAYAYEGGGEDAVDDEEGEEADSAEPRKGILSDESINVVLVADLDFAGDQFYSMYRNIDAENEDLGSLSEVANIQFMTNAVDFLYGDTAFLKLRTQRSEYRSLTRMDELRERLQRGFSEEEEKTRLKFENEEREARAKFEEKLAQIDKMEGDAAAREQIKVATRQKEQRRLDQRLAEIEKEKERQLRKVRSEIRAEVDDRKMWVRTLAVLVPALLILVLSVVVYAVRAVHERMDIPAARRRS